MELMRPIGILGIWGIILSSAAGCTLAQNTPPNECPMHEVLVDASAPDGLCSPVNTDAERLSEICPSIQSFRCCAYVFQCESVSRPDGGPWTLCRYNDCPALR